MADDQEPSLVSFIRREPQLVDYAFSHGAKRRPVRWRVGDGGPISDSIETMLAASLLPAMRVGAPLVVPVPASARLVANLPEIQRIFHRWRPDAFKLVDVQAVTREPAAPPGPRGAATFFSGGADSMFTALEHLDELDGLIFCVGFDVALDNKPLREAVLQSVRAAAEELGKPLVEVVTSVHLFSRNYVGWELFHGSALASVAHLLSPRFSRVYVPASRDKDLSTPWGSHPDVDPLWSSELVELVHDGVKTLRVDKIGRIASHPVALRHLRVCWLNPGNAFNCGRCEKCLRTMIALRIAGALDRAERFPRELDLSRVAALPNARKSEKAFARENLAAAERVGDGALIDALRKSLGPR